MALLISISWNQPSPTTGITGYNIYTVVGAPPNTTKTFLAFNNGVSNTSYTYTGVEGTNYQFEVRSTDGTNESPPLEIFYPDGTSLWTPTLLTPTGQPMMTPRDVAYLDKDTFLNYASGLKLTTSDALYTSGILDVYLQAASEQVNRYCHRHFQRQTIDEVFDGVRIYQYEPRMIAVQLNEAPIQDVVRIDIQVLKWFINFSLDYLQVFPDKGYYQIVPFLGGNQTGLPLPGSVLTENILAKIWTRYDCGYDVIPDAVKVATSIFATKMIGLQENPVSAESVRFGRNFQLDWDKDNDPLMHHAQALLEPYRLTTYRRP